MTRRMVHIWFDIMHFITDVYSVALGLPSLMEVLKVLKGEMKALEVMLDSMSFFLL